MRSMATAWLKVGYKSAAGNLKHAEFMPLSLAPPRRALVSGEPLQWVRERPQPCPVPHSSAQVSTLSSERRKSFDLQQFDDDRRFGFGEGKRIRISFRIGKKAGFHLLESPLSNDQRVASEDDHYAISATVVDTAQLQWWLRGFGDQIENVLRKASPQYVRS